MPTDLYLRQLDMETDEAIVFAMELHEIPDSNSFNESNCFYD